MARKKQPEPLHVAYSKLFAQHQSTEKPICPFCSAENADPLGQDKSTACYFTVNCCNCGLGFRVTKWAVPRYSTAPISDL
jgi:transcription elongation factor Elf1